MKDSTISWTDHTFNPWWGCTEVSPGCDNCYARELSKRFQRVEWGHGVPRRLTSDAYWREPLKWDRAAAAAGRRDKVFCLSMGDVFDAEVPAGWRERLWALIRLTPHLDWLLLTKRPNLIEKNLPDDWGDGYENVWLGTSVEGPEQLWRAAALLKVRARVRFLSCEPLLAELDALSVFLYSGYIPAENDVIHWVIVGGESGPNARPCNLEWIRGLVRQCQAAGTAVWVKQLGRVVIDRNDAEFDGDTPTAWPEGTETNVSAGYQGAPVRVFLRDRKGENPEEWPEDLRIREMPVVGR